MEQMFFSLNCLFQAADRQIKGWNEIVGGEIINPPHQFPFLTSLQRNWPANP